MTNDLVAFKNVCGFKKLDTDAMKDPDYWQRREMIRRWPQLKDKEFDIRRIKKPCPSCEAGTTFQNRKERYEIDIFQVKYKGKDEWKDVPDMGPTVCQTCTAERLGWEAEEEDKRARVRHKTAHLWIINEELQKANLSNFKPNDLLTAEALDISEKYLEDFKNGKRYSLIFRGTYGAGKSHLLKAIAETIKNDLKKENGDPFTVGFIPMEDVLTMIKNTWDDKTGPHTEQSIVRDLIDLDFLVLDDAGSEGGDFAGKKLFEIINGRMGKPTGITTNFEDWEKFADRFGPNGGKIVSRIRSKAKVFDIQTTDKRIQEF